MNVSNSQGVFLGILIVLGIFALIEISLNDVLAADCSERVMDSKVQAWMGAMIQNGPSKDGGVFRHYENNASIYCHPRTGVFEVHGAIRSLYSSLNWEWSFLGYPLTDELTTPDGQGRYNHFQGGSIYWHPNTGAHEVHGLIKQKWSELGWERGTLGYPISNELVDPKNPDGRYSIFQGGVICWNPRDGVKVVEAATGPESCTKSVRGDPPKEVPPPETPQRIDPVKTVPPKTEPPRDVPPPTQRTDPVKVIPQREVSPEKAVPKKETEIKRVEQPAMPSWFRTNADWWRTDRISEKDMINGIESLISKNIIKIDPDKISKKITESEPSSLTKPSIPAYVKEVFGFWADGKVSDTEVVNSVQFLVNTNVIKISNEQLGALFPDLYKKDQSGGLSEKTESMKVAAPTTLSPKGQKTHFVTFEVKQLGNEYAYGVLSHKIADFFLYNTGTPPPDAVDVTIERYGKNKAPSIPGPSIIVNEGDDIFLTIINQIPNSCAGARITGLKHGEDSYGTLKEKNGISDQCSSFAKKDKPYTYHWFASEGTSGTWAYYDQTLFDSNGGKDSGLFGVVIVNKEKSTTLLNGKIKEIPTSEIDREFVMFMSGVQFYVNTIDNTKGGLETSLGINPTIDTKKGEFVRFHVLNTNSMPHTFHLHGHRWIEPGTTDVIDTRSIENLASHVFTVTAGEGVGPGHWHYHCHVFSHMKAGMMGIFNVSEEKAFFDPHQPHSMQTSGLYLPKKEPVLSLKPSDPNNISGFAPSQKTIDAYVDSIKYSRKVDLSAVEKNEIQRQFPFNSHKTTNSWTYAIEVQPKPKKTHHIVLEASDAYFDKNNDSKYTEDEWTFNYRLREHKIESGGSVIYDLRQDKLKNNVHPTIPGPTIIVDEGDDIYLTIRNSIKDSCAGVHVHGVYYRIDHDGSRKETNGKNDQCAIGQFSGQTYTYHWIAGQGTAGTWPYHDHSLFDPNGAEDEGLFGMIIVNKPKTTALINNQIKEIDTSSIDKELVIYLTDEEMFRAIIDKDDRQFDLDIVRNNKDFFVGPDKIVRFHVVSLGNYAKTFEVSGHTWIEPGTNKIVKSKTLVPLEKYSFTISMKEGTWSYGDISQDMNGKIFSKKNTVSSSPISGFQGFYTPTNLLSQAIDASSAPSSLYLHGNKASGWHYIAIDVPCDGTVSFDWEFNPGKVPPIKAKAPLLAQFLINGVQIAEFYEKSLPAKGSQAIPVSVGEQVLIEYYTYQENVHPDVKPKPENNYLKITNFKAPSDHCLY